MLNKVQKNVYIIVRISSKPIWNKLQVTYCLSHTRKSTASDVKGRPARARYRRIRAERNAPLPLLRVSAHYIILCTRAFYIVLFIVVVVDRSAAFVAIKTADFRRYYRRPEDIYNNNDSTFATTFTRRIITHIAAASVSLIWNSVRFHDTRLQFSIHLIHINFI